MLHSELKSHVGLDISKDTIDACILPEQEHFTIANTKAGYKELIKRLPSNVERIVMEPTSKYGRDVLSALHKKSYPVCAINPRRIRHFASGLGILAKTDKVDALVCATYAEKVESALTQPIDEKQQKLAEHEIARKQVVESITAYKNRLSVADSSLKRTYRSIINQLEKHKVKLSERIAKLISENEAWKAMLDVLVDIKGIGATSAGMFLARLPELGQISERAIASLVGVAPFNCDSGLYRGRRKVYGGRHDVRTGLYMVTLVAVRHTPVITAFYERLLEKGKPKKVALTACMRKFIVIINAKMRDHLSQQACLSA